MINGFGCYQYFGGFNFPTPTLAANNLYEFVCCRENFNEIEVRSGRAGCH